MFGGICYKFGGVSRDFYVYDERLYERLRTGVAETVCDHLCAGLDSQNMLIRFLENHDEP